MAKTYARFIKDVPFGRADVSRKLWYVPRKRAYIASSASAAFGGEETYLFLSNAAGDLVDLCELPGSYRGGLDHEQAIRNAGWEVA